MAHIMAYREGEEECQVGVKWEPGRGLRLMLAQRAGEALPDPVQTEPIPQDVASSAIGRYASGERTIEIRSRADRLEAFSRVTGNTYRLRVASSVRGSESSALSNFELVADDRRSFGTRFVFSPEGLTVSGELYTRVPEASAPGQVPGRWRGLRHDQRRQWC